MSQKSPLSQLALSAQVVRQAVGPQMKGVQSVVEVVGQVPIPSQTLGFCWVLPVQLAFTEPQATPTSA